MININRVITVLTDTECYSPELREFAAATFSSWLNCEDEGDEFLWGQLMFVHRLWADKRNQGLPIDISVFNPLYDPTQVLENLKNSSACLPFFWFNEEANKYNTMRYVADIVRFFLSYEPQSTDKREQASLGRAFEFLNRHDGFVAPLSREERFTMSAAAHQNQWKKLKSKSCFYFVRYYGKTLDWLIDPRDKDALSIVKMYVNDVDKLNDFFGKSAWVQSKFAEKIDYRSMSKAEFVELPVNIRAVPIRVPRFPKDGYRALSTYQRNRATW